MNGTDRWQSESPVVFAHPPKHKAGHTAKRRVGVEYSPSVLEPVRQGAVSPDRALCLPTFSHFVIVNKTSPPPPTLTPFNMLELASSRSEHTHKPPFLTIFHHSSAQGRE